MKIVLIGPVYPYKGGISHYTGLMYKTLSKEHEVTMISYSLQYPKFMYKKEQRDYSNDTFRIENTEYIINTANPTSWHRTVKRIGEIKPQLVIIQWWHPYFAPCYTYIARHIQNMRILFICHNVFPHERFPLDRWLTKRSLKKGSHYIVQSHQDEADLQTIIDDPVYKRTVHPTYNVFKLQGIDKRQARNMLGLENEKILLFFGFVREYKGLKYLIKAMPRITEKLQGIKLFIVGDFGSDKADYLKLIEEKKVSNNIVIADGYVPDKEVEKYFAACDLVVLPYVSATQSGIVQIAYGFNKPVLATDVGGLPDVVNDGETGYLVKPCDPNAIVDAVVDFYENERAEAFEENVLKEAYRFSWERMRECIENLCFT